MEENTKNLEPREAQRLLLKNRELARKIVMTSCATEEGYARLLEFFGVSKDREETE